ncbi:MAG: DNA methyltransferase [Candidatus Latescibacterota bacterium]
MSQTRHIIVRGDSRCMRELPDESIHMIVTSPPYWQLKDYGVSGQIGFDDSYESYINNLNLVWRECGRVLHPGCRLCVNIGDQFARAAYYGRYKVIPIRTEIIRFCETIGLDYMGAIIWRKVTTTNTTGGASIMGSFPYPRNGILKLDYEFILLFKKPGRPPEVSGERKERSKLTTEEWNAYFQGHWHFSGVKQDDHIAMFPEELPRRLIRMFSFVGETVLDPFAGSGTTSLAARNLDRNSFGYEINPEFIPVISRKIGADENALFPDATFSFREQEPLPVDLQQEIDRLPYRFRDPLVLNRRPDSHGKRFGSRVGRNDPEREEYYTVSEVIGPGVIRLKDGRVVHLLGIHPDSSQYDAAREFLSEKVNGKQVSLKYDGGVIENGDAPACYVYLRNRTFVNAHLIRSGLVNVDMETEYDLREKFIRLSQDKSRKQ